MSVSNFNLILCQRALSYLVYQSFSEPTSNGQKCATLNQDFKLYIKWVYYSQGKYIIKALLYLH